MAKPTPKYVPGALERPTEAELFTDREEFIKAFEDALAAITPEAPKVLVFHGPGGIGKSAIRDELKRRLERGDYAKVGWGLVQFDAETRNAPDVALAILGQQLNDTANVDLRVFEIASAVYWRKKHPHIELIQKNFPFFKLGSLFFTVAGAIVPGLSLGTVITEGLDNLEKPLRERLKKWWGAKGKEYLRGMEYQEAEVVLEKLPAFFGSDLQNFLNAKKRAVIFIDGYEKIWLSEARVRFADDAWVRELVASCPGVLFVLCSRYPLRWAEHDEKEGEAWAACTEQICVPDFEEEYTRELLSKAGITEEPVVKAIADGAAGVPFYADICIDIYYAIKAAGREPTAEDFPPTHREILERFTRDLSTVDDETLKVVGAPRFFDENLFRELVTHFQTGYPVTAFDDFVRFSFIRQGDAALTYRIHDLLRDHIKVYTGEEKSRKANAFLFDYYRERAEVEGPLNVTEENVTALREALYHGLESQPLNEVQVWFASAARHYKAAALFAELENLYLIIKERIEEKLGLGSPILIEILHNLGSIYYELGNYSAAETSLKKGLKIAVKNLGKKHINIAVGLDSIGALYEDTGRNKTAIRLYLKSLSIKKEFLGPADAAVAITLNNLGWSYGQEGEFDMAVMRLRECLIICEHNNISDPTIYAAALNNLAMVYEGNGYNYEALPLYERSLEVATRKYGHDHPYVAYTLNNLGAVYVKTGKYRKAIENLEKALGILEAILPENHPKIIMVLSNLNVAYKGIGDLKTAMEFEQRAEELKKSREEEK